MNYKKTVIGLLAMLAMIFGAYCSAGTTNTPSQDPLRSQDPIVKDGSPQMWALATDAIHSTAQKAGLNRLRWGSATKANIEYVKKDLAEGPWRIYNRQDVLRKLKDTQSAGYTQMFLSLGKNWTNASTDERNAFLSLYGNNTNIMNRISIVEEHYPQLKKKGLLAWDLARYIALCRRAYTAGYLEREEAWDMIMSVAQQLQSLFDSWEDLGENYLLGRRFWSKRYADLGNESLRKRLKTLLSDKTSVWNKTPWNLDLKPIDKQSAPDNS